jgi:hypothetical protein
MHSLPLDCLGLAKSAALVRIGDERTALVLTLGASQPDTMLPPVCPSLASAHRPEDVAAGEAMMGDAVRAAGLAAEADGDVRGAAVLSAWCLPKLDSNGAVCTETWAARSKRRIVANAFG